jgi:hypothetical protein
MSDKLQGGILAGSTNVSLPVILRKTADNTEQTGILAAGVTANYWRQGGTPTALTAASDLAAITSAFAAGGWKAADGVNAPGVYRLDVDNAAFASGADWVIVAVKVANCYLFVEKYALTSNAIQTGDSYARLGAPAGATIEADIAAIKAQTTSLVAGVTVSGYTTGQDPATLVWVQAMTEPTSVPSVTDTILHAMEWLFVVAHNKITETATTQLVRNNADNATIGTSTVSDDGTTFTRGGYV